MKKIILCLLTIYTSITMAAEPPLQKLTVMLDWLPNPNHAPLIIAQQQGFFKEQGLDVTLVSPTNTTDTPKQIANGQVDIAVEYQPTFMQQVDNGMPLIRIGTLIDRPLNCIVVLKDSGINTFADLKGKNIAATNGAFSAILLKSLLTKHQLTEKDVALVNIQDNLEQALLNHQVDAVTGMTRNFEVPDMEANGYQVTEFFPEDYGIPNYSELVFVSNVNKAHDDRYARFLVAVKNAVAYLDAHPRETWQQFADQYPQADNQINREAWFATMPYFAEEPALFDSDEWQQFAAFMQQNQLIKVKQPVSRYAISLLPTTA